MNKLLDIIAFSFVYLILLPIFIILALFFWPCTLGGIITYTGLWSIERLKEKK